MPFKINVLARHFCVLLALLLSTNIFAQKTVTGRVTSNADKQPIAGATVQVRGSKIATQTGPDGTFSINAPQDNSVLLISVIGFETQTIAIGGRASIGEVPLIVSTTSLNDVVVTGYTSQRKKDITGAVTVVNVSEMKTQPAIDAGSQLQGRASGVTVVQNGVPGQASTVRIRGLGSFNNNSPLYVIDGVQSGSITGLTPDDIESMQVLKDAASASIYGVRGSNGVVVITTKKGKKRGVTVTYNGYYGSQNPGKGFDLLNAQEEANLLFLARTNSGLPTSGSVFGSGTTPVLPDYIYYTGAPNDGTPIMNGNPNVDPALYDLNLSKLGDAGYSPYVIVPTSKSGTNWYDVITRSAPIQNHNISMAGSNDNSRFFLGLNYFNQQAITEYQFYKRFSVRMNSEFSATKFFRIGENLQMYYDNGNVTADPTNSTIDNNTETGIVTTTFRETAIVPVYTIKPGDFAGNHGGSGFGTWGNSKNPLAVLYRNQNNRLNNINIFGNVYGEVDFFPHFTLRSSFGGAINTSDSYSYPFIEYENQENTSNTTYKESMIRNNNWIWTNQINYKNTFGKHSIAAVIGTEAQKGGGRQIIGAATGFFNYNYQPYINLGNGGVQNLGGSQTFTPTTTQSYFANVNYEYAGKYLASATFRRDGSSKFLDPNKWGNFPAFSLGWRISEESFMRDITWINDLKIRGSWGKMGNEVALTAGNAFTTFGSNRQSSWYDLNGTSNNPTEGFYGSFVGNPLGKWETGVTTNIGFDGTFFHNSTEIVFDWYQKKTQDLLYNPGQQGILGGVPALQPAYQNVGSMQNTGIDVMISNKANITRDIRLNTAVTFTTYTNKITAITQDGQLYFDYNSPVNEANRIGSNATRNILGQPMNTFFGYKVLGLFQTADEVSKSTPQPGAAPGRFKYANIDGNDTIDANDRTVIGNPNPKFTYGINIGLEFKNFDLTAFFYGVQGKDAFNSVKWWTDYSSGFPGGRSKNALYDSWLPDGSRPNAKTPIEETTVAAAGFSTSGVINSYYVEDASYFRLRNLTIGYTIPVNTLNKVHITKVRIYLQGTNLFTITKYTGLNPDIVSTDDRAASIDIGAYPTVRQYLVGANITF